MLREVFLRDLGYNHVEAVRVILEPLFPVEKIRVLREVAGDLEEADRTALAFAILVSVKTKGDPEFDGAWKQALDSFAKMGKFLREGKQ